MNRTPEEHGGAGDAVIARFLARIAGVRSRVARLILFGSHARGEAKYDSDYDVLVIVPRKDRELIDALYEAVVDVLVEHGRVISLKIFEEREFDRLRALRTPFMKQVLDEGVTIG